MNKLVKESEYFLAWLVFWLCTTFGGLVVGVIAGFVIGASLGAAGVDLTTIKVICGGVGFILGGFLSYVLFRVFVGSMIVNKAQARFQSMMQELSDQATADIVG